MKPRLATAQDLKKLLKGRRSKYGNKPVMWNGERFDSMGERDRWLELMIIQNGGGRIRNLKRQVRYELAGGVVLVADFEYEELTYAEGTTATGFGPPRYWVQVSEDFKSKPTMTAAFRIKARLFEEKYGRSIRISGRRR